MEIILANRFYNILRKNMPTSPLYSPILACQQRLAVVQALLQYHAWTVIFLMRKVVFSICWYTEYRGRAKNLSNSGTSWKVLFDTRLKQLVVLAQYRQGRQPAIHAYPYSMTQYHGSYASVAGKAYTLGWPFECSTIELSGISKQSSSLSAYFNLLGFFNEDYACDELKTVAAASAIQLLFMI